VVEWSRALDVRLSEWCCSASMVWVQIPLIKTSKHVTVIRYTAPPLNFNGICNTRFILYNIYIYRGPFQPSEAIINNKGTQQGQYEKGHILILLLTNFNGEYSVGMS
jgi:hypothetical protein